MGLLTLVVGAVACSLNPQPLPPQDGVTADSGFGADAGAEAAVPFKDAGGNGDGGNFEDAGTDASPPLSDAGDASSDASDDASDAGDAGDASSDAVAE